MVLITTIFLTGCSRYETWDANFIGINRSYAKIIVIVDGIELGALLPTATANFTVKVTSGKVPNSMTGASQNRTSNVSITIKNTMNDRVTVVFCWAGERQKTTFIFESFNGYDTVNCNTNQ